MPEESTTQPTEEAQTKPEGASKKDILSTPQIEAKEMDETKERLTEIIARHTGQTVKKVMADSERNFYMSAEEALKYGLVDEIISSRKMLKEK